MPRGITQSLPSACALRGQDRALRCLRARLRVVARVAGQPDLLTAVPEHQIGAGVVLRAAAGGLISDFEYADTQPGRLGGRQSDEELTPVT